MNVASEIVVYESRGFRREQAESILLMKYAAKALFRDFPDCFLLFGGATLLLFHNSVRHSNDLDLLSTAERLPASEAVVHSLKQGLQDVAEALKVAPLAFDIEKAETPELKIGINSNTSQRLLRIDFTRRGSVIQSEIEVRALDDGATPAVKSVSRDFLLLQKAEAFLLRRAVKARDAYDADLLLNSGASLNENLRNHLADTLANEEIAAEDIESRLAKLTPALCRLELKPLLPPEVYVPLERDEFRRLHEALRSVYKAWL